MNLVICPSGFISEDWHKNLFNFQNEQFPPESDVKMQSTGLQLPSRLQKASQQNALSSQCIWIQVCREINMKCIFSFFIMSSFTFSSGLILMNGLNFSLNLWLVCFSLLKACCSQSLEISILPVFRLGTNYIIYLGKVKENTKSSLVILFLDCSFISPGRSLVAWVCPYNTTFIKGPTYNNEPLRKHK